MFGFGKRKREKEIAEAVSEQITDAVTAANASVLGHNPAYSLDQTLLAQSQAHGALFANMVSEQQRLVTAGQAAAIKSAAEIFGISPDALTSSKKNEE